MKILRDAAIGLILTWTLSSEGADYAGWAVGAAGGGYGTILRTADSGATRARQGLGQIGDAGLSGVFAVNPLTAWVVGDAESGYATIYHTTDGGLTWSRKGSAAQVPNTTLRKVATFGDGNIWAVGPGAILHSSDGGASWANQIPAGFESVGLQGVFTPDGIHVWATGGVLDGYATILKSSDGGLSWARQSAGGVTNADHLLGLSAVDANTAWAVGGKANENGYVALHTINGGDTWELQPGVVGVQDANEVCAVNSSVVWAACDGTVYRSSDAGENWIGKSKGPFTLGISAVSEEQAWAVVGGVQGEIWHTADSGVTWEEQGIPGERLTSLSTVSFASSVIPEPATVVLLAGGLAALWRRRPPAASGRLL